MRYRVNVKFPSPFDGIDPATGTLRQWKRPDQFEIDWDNPKHREWWPNLQYLP